MCLLISKQWSHHQHVAYCIQKVGRRWSVSLRSYELKLILDKIHMSGKIHSTMQSLYGRFFKYLICDMRLSRAIKYQIFNKKCLIFCSMSACNYNSWPLCLWLEFIIKKKCWRKVCLKLASNEITNITHTTLRR